MRITQMRIWRVMVAVAFVALGCAVCMPTDSSEVPFQNWPDQDKADWYAYRERTYLRYAEFAERGLDYEGCPLAEQCDCQLDAKTLRDLAEFCAALSRWHGGKAVAAQSRKKAAR